MSVPPTLSAEALLREDQWARRLARRLASDPEAAEDLVQDTWVQVLSAPPGERPRALRPWLAGVLRHLRLDWRHATEQRSRREQRAARGEALPATDELVSELEARRLLVTRLLELEEPYRRTLLLRFFRDESLKAIAAAEGVSITAIHERLQRGLGRLRAELSRGPGGRDGWARAFVALLAPAGPLKAFVEVLTMASVAKAAAVLVVIGGGAALWWSDREGERGPAPEVSTAAAVRLAAEPMTSEAAPTPVREAPREALPVGSEPSPAPSAPEPVAVPVPEPGRVVDVRGTPLARVEVLRLGKASAARATSDASGAFTLPTRAPEAPLVCADPGLLTLLAGAPSPDGVRLLVAAPRADFAGRVIDEDGNPVSGARLSFRVRDALFRDLALVPSQPFLRGAEDAAPVLEASTELDGSFALAELFGGPNAFLSVQAEGYEGADTIELPEAGDLDLLVRLARVNRGLRLTGVVLDPDGRPVEGAAVSAGDEIVRTDGEGHFELVWKEGTGRYFAGPDGEYVEEPSHEADVVAVKAGFQPARQDGVSLDPRALLVLHLGPPPPSIRGRVLDGDGRPRAGTVVWIGDPTPLGSEMRPLSERIYSFHQTSLEEELRVGEDPRGVRTDGDGRFTLGGLVTREYALFAFDPLTAEQGGPFAVTAGRGEVELVLPRDPSAGPVAGRVFSLGGTPVAGVRVRPLRAPDSDSAPPILSQDDLETDEQGRFAFDRLVREDVVLLLLHPRLPRCQVRLADQRDASAIEVVQPLLCELQVDLGDPGRAEALRVLDAGGDAVMLSEPLGGGTVQHEEIPIREGRTSVILVPETARTLVLLQGGSEVERRPLHLDPTGRTTLRP